MRRSLEDVYEMYEGGVEDTFGEALVMDPAEDMTRQEFAAEVDTHTILKRYGGVPAAPAHAFGSSVDFRMDLQAALTAQRAARVEYMRAPAELKLKYKTYQQFVTAIERGELGVREIPDPPPAPDPTDPSQQKAAFGK